jgi:hypothetical protein
MSAPAQKARPAPVMTMVPMDESSLPHWMAFWYSAIMRGVQAFSFSV